MVLVFSLAMAAPASSVEDAEWVPFAAWLDTDGARGLLKADWKSDANFVEWLASKAPPLEDPADVNIFEKGVPRWERVKFWQLPGDPGRNGGGRCEQWGCATTNPSNATIVNCDNYFRKCFFRKRINLSIISIVHACIIAIALVIVRETSVRRA